MTLSLSRLHEINWIQKSKRRPRIRKKLINAAAFNKDDKPIRAHERFLILTRTGLVYSKNTGHFRWCRQNKHSLDHGRGRTRTLLSCQIR